MGDGGSEIVRRRSLRAPNADPVAVRVERRIGSRMAERT
jgi:hypothetical protein